MQAAITCNAAKIVHSAKCVGRLFLQSKLNPGRSATGFFSLTFLLAGAYQRDTAPREHGHHGHDGSQKSASTMAVRPVVGQSDADSAVQLRHCHLGQYSPDLNEEYLALEIEIGQRLLTKRFSLAL